MSNEADETEKRKVEQVAQSPTRLPRDKGQEEKMDEGNDEEKRAHNQGKKKKIRKRYVKIDDWVKQKRDSKNDTKWKPEGDKDALRQMQGGQDASEPFQFGSNEGRKQPGQVLFPPTPPTLKSGTPKGKKGKTAKKQNESKDSKSASKKREIKKKGVMKAVSFVDDPLSHTLIIEFGVPLDYEKGKKSIDIFQDRLHKTLAFIREHAGEGKSNFVILPKDEKKTKMKPLKDKSSFPKHQISWMSHYGEFDNNYAFPP